MNVEVGSTEWSPAFIEYLQDEDLGTNGYAIPVGSTAQSAVIPWINVNQIMITFSEDVHVHSANLSLSGVNSVAYAFADFHYNPQERLATWTLAAPLTKDRLRIDLDGDGLNPVRDLAGNVLDGEWSNHVSTYSSGNGVAGGDFEFTFNVLPTDSNNSGAVTSYDYFYIRILEGKSTNDPDYLATHDVDGSGLIEQSDWQAALDRANDQLPAGLPAGTYNDAPSTEGIGRVEINNATADVTVSVPSNFDDAESSGEGLVYTIAANSNPSLFDTASIHPTSKNLVLNTASGVSGRSEITIRATDPSGLFIETVVTVDVNRQNQAPYLIANFVPIEPGVWLAWGNVSDSDDDVSKFIVEFTGVYTARACVDESGEFEFSVYLDPEVTGEVEAVTFDPHLLSSNVRKFWVGEVT